MIKVITTLATLGALLITSMAKAGPTIELINAAVMLAPPGVSVTAGFMTLENTGQKDIVIESITAKDFQRVEMHKTEVKDGMARMIQQQHLTIPAGGRLELSHGSYHMMLYAPARGFNESDSVQLTLHTDAGDFTINAPVKRLTL